MVINVKSGDGSNLIKTVHVMGITPCFLGLLMNIPWAKHLRNDILGKLSSNRQIPMPNEAKNSKNMNQESMY